MRDKPKRDFDSVAATWDNEPRRVKLAADVVEAIRITVPLTSEMTVLDYGCGSGLVTLGLHEMVGRITGADSSRGMLDVVERKMREHGIENVDTVQIDLEEQGQLPGTYDLIVSSMTMHHVKDVPDLVGALIKRLRPGGWLALADLETEDGTFHDDPTGIEHHGFSREFFSGLFAAKELREISVNKAADMVKGGRPYSVLLAVGRKL